MVLVDSQCQSCQTQLLNSVFDSNSHTCVCSPGFKFKNSGCVKNSSNRTVAIAVAVPVGVILLAIVTAMVVIKKKGALKIGEEARQVEQIPRQEVQVAQEVYLPQIVDEHVDVVPEIQSPETHNHQ
ncbi:Hypothetical_protein [Hexamita inflata]|uniref:Hypothetical_protein n=1 Tax=Hexamita inflata TaxID=28002 RepID=A0AA86RNL1_9EUKA|nr:Hypothetical protein HINF_LOCUS62934 [Hexamita inflata]